MDPLSQGSLGATLAQSGSSQEKVRSATLLGCFGGLAPDLDILIFSPTDPLLFLEFHRQFTHALVFIPVGALLVAAIMHRWLGRGLSFRESYLFCLLGYATHGLLDACTTYGTQLLWPFSDMRIAWNTVSIVDPIFTLPIVFLIVSGVIKRNPWPGRAALAWALVYLSIGVYQRERVEAAGYELAHSRGHEPIRLEAKPGFAQLLLWKIVYETESHFHVDAVRVAAQTRFYPGDRAEILNLARHFPWLNSESQQARDVERFRWFSNDYLAIDPEVPGRIIDVRYSIVPNEIDTLWAIDLDPDKGPEEHITWISLERGNTDQADRWWQMLTE